MSLLLLTAVLVPLAFFIGIGASAIGLTAWMMLVPILFVFFGFDLYLTLFISLLLDCGNALIMTIFAGQNGQLKVRTGLKLSMLSALFVCLGIYVGTRFIPENKEFFKAPALFFNFLFGLGFLRRGYRSGRLEAALARAEANGEPLAVEGSLHSSPVRRHAVYAAIALVGFQSGLFGIGGGALYSVSLMFCLSFSTLLATGTAMFMTLCTTTIAASGIFFQIPAETGLSRPLIIVLLTMVFFSMIGTILGARVAYTLSLKWLNYMIAAVIFLAVLIAGTQQLLIGA